MTHNTRSSGLKPAREERSTVQNQRGAKFENVTSTWANTESSINLVRFSGEVYLMSVMYVLTQVYLQYDAGISRLEGKPKL